jgi:hypothetical protein
MEDPVLATAVRPHHSALFEEIVSNPSNPVESYPASAPRTASLFFRAGDQVPAPGSYRVWHKHHRTIHAAKVRFTVFPACAQCGESVRYLPIDEQKSSASEWLRRDPDFRYALAGKGRKKTAAR